MLSLGAPAWPNLVLTQAGLGPPALGPHGGRRSLLRGEAGPRSGGHPELASGTSSLGLSPWVGRRSPELGVGYGWGADRQVLPRCGAASPRPGKGAGPQDVRRGLGCPHHLRWSSGHSRDPTCPGGRLVSPDGPSRQNRPSPDPSAQAPSSNQQPGWPCAGPCFQRCFHSVGIPPGAAGRDAGPTRQWAPGLPGGHCGFPCPCCPERAPGVRGGWGEVPRGPMRLGVGGWCHCCELCAHKCACVCTRFLRARRGDPCAAVCEPLALCLSWSRWWLWSVRLQLLVWPTPSTPSALGVSMAEAQGPVTGSGEESGEMGQGAGVGRGGAGTGTLKQVCG